MKKSITVMSTLALVFMLGVTGCDKGAKGKENCYAPKAPFADAKAFTACVKGAVKKVDAGAVNLKDFDVVIDIRTATEIEAGVIQGSKTMDAGLLPYFVQKLVPNKNSKVLVYCKTGGRSAIATQILTAMGYNVTSLEGGYEAFTKTKYDLNFDANGKHSYKELPAPAVKK